MSSEKLILVTSGVDDLACRLNARCQDTGVQVRYAADARQALFVVHKCLPDVVIMDSDISLEDGLSAFTLMQSDLRMRAIKMIVMVTSDDAALRARIEERGFTCVFAGEDPVEALEPAICMLFPKQEQRTSGAPVSTLTGRIRDEFPVPDDAPLVLVIDDDVIITQAINIRMATSGYRVICAHNGVDAFTVAKECLPDVITLDVGLPNMDGLGLMQNLKAHPSTSRIPIIVLTGQKQPELEKVFMDMGAYAFMTKPFRTSAVLEHIERAIQLYGRRRASARRR